MNIMDSIREWIKSLRSEDPRRLRAFRNATQDLLWNEEHILSSLSMLFRAVDDLAEAEVDYYYRRRGTRALISGISRFGAWLFGTVGLLLPLLAAANSKFIPLTQCGYVFLAGAASCLAANSLFGGTEGHIRFVSTQLTLEKMITKTRISWCEYLSLPREDPQKIRSGFLLVQEYAEELHKITISETGMWGQMLLKELTKFKNEFVQKGLTQNEHAKDTTIPPMVIQSEEKEDHPDGLPW